jgi:hypothetical protein
MWHPCRDVIIGAVFGNKSHPCGGGFKYLHRDLTSSRRRQKRKYKIWESKIWSGVPRDLHPRKITLARTISVYKRQTHTLVREGAPQKQDRNCQTLTNIWSWAPDGVRHQDLLIDWPSVAMWHWLWLVTSQLQDCSVESPTVKRRLYVWYLECVIQWVCIVIVLKSVARKLLLKTQQT